MKYLALSFCLIITFNLSALSQHNAIFVADQDFVHGQRFQGVEIGGLSGMTYDRQSGKLFIVADVWERENRIFEASIRYVDSLPKIEITNVILLKDRYGQVLGPKSFDHEAITIGPNGNFLITNEGIYDENTGEFIVRPSVNIFSRKGLLIGALSLPEDLVNYGHKNKFLEGISYNKQTGELIASMESSLTIDGGLSTLNQGSKIRFLSWQWNQARSKFEIREQRHYPLGRLPIPTSSSKAEIVQNDYGFSFGVSAIAHLPSNDLLVLERGFIRGINKSPVKLYQTDFDSLPLASARPIQSNIKNSVLDIEQVVPLMKTKRSDNFEIVTVVPIDSDWTLLILGTDNNFSQYQRTNFTFIAVPN
jgi:hypothetical protein